MTRSAAAVSAALASIPSPSSNKLGPFTAYGLMIALGVLAAIWLARRRWEQRGGNPEDITVIAVWAVPAGLIGARLYHVVTDNQLYRGHWFDNPFAASGQSPLAVWNGGLGIPGGILAGVVTGVLVARHLKIRVGPGLDAVAPALPLAQAIGRLGNWFNQELYGGPTDLPWGLRIDPAHRPPALAQYETFHPTFLYEGLWNLGLVFFIIWLDGKRVLRPGRMFLVYLAGYFLGRLWVESLRSDSANTIAGLRVNTWTSLLVIAGVVIAFAVGGVRRRPGDSDAPYREGFVPRGGPLAPGAETGGGTAGERAAGAVADQGVPGRSGPDQSGSGRNGSGDADGPDDGP